MEDEEPDVFISCIKCGFKEPVEKVKDPYYFYCNECYMLDKVDLSMISNKPYVTVWIY